MLQTSYVKYKYTPDEMTSQEFLERFVVRNEIFNEIFDEIKTADFDITNQHYIIVGQRGQGKTTLLRKLQLEVENDKKLSSFLLPVKFAEEQYRIKSLSRLWEEVADYLQTIYEDSFEDVLDEMEKHFDDEDYDLKSFSLLEKYIKKQDKKLLLLIDNIDELFGKLKKNEQQQLREILLSSSSFIIVGGSTKMFEQHYEYGKPFYEFFKILRLKGLTLNECKTLLLAIGSDEQKAIIENIIEHNLERIEVLRQLTGGVPRTMIMLFDIFMDENGNAFDDLLKVLDDVTPLYKHRMDDLPAVLQDIVDTIALNWDGMFTKEIAKKTRMPSKDVSAQLKQLEKYQIVEAEYVGKNKIYKIQERFFNIWYLMRFGRKKDRQKVEWLVKFLLSWFTKEELENRAKSLISSLKNGKVKESYAYHMCEALSYSGINSSLEHELKKSTKEFLNNKKSILKDDISDSEDEILKKAILLINDKKIKKAIKLLESSQKNTISIMKLCGVLYLVEKNYEKVKEYYLKTLNLGDKSVLNDLGAACYELKEYEEAEEYYIKAIKSGNKKTFNNLGVLYYELKNYEKAEEYYLKAIKEEDNITLLYLGLLYKDLKDYKKAEEYYLKAIEKKYYDALNSLGILYGELKNYKKAEEYYLKAIEKKNNDALNNLGNLYKDLKDYEKAEEYYFKAIKNKNNETLVNLGILYSDLKDYKKAEEYYLKALDFGHKDALNGLGFVYQELKDYKKAEEYYLKAIRNNNIEALNNLGTLYSDLKDYKKAEEYYLEAIKKGENNSLNSLAWLYFEKGINSKEALNLIEESYKEKNFFNTHSFAIILLWKEEFSKSYEVFLQWLNNYEEAVETQNDISIYLNLLIAKGQYYKAKEFLELEKYNLKERYKPIWYALMTYMKDDFPNESKKMGSELQVSVEEVVKEIEKLNKKYEI